MTVRIQNAIALGLNRHQKLPKYMVVLLDADIIEKMKYSAAGIASLYGKWLS